MRWFLIVFASLFVFHANHAQDTKSIKDFEFIYNLPATDVKDQGKTGTCWSFATISFLESELLRIEKGEYDLSEMFIVWHTYVKKALKYVRMHKTINFDQGGEPNDVTEVIDEYGIMPEEIYSGLPGRKKRHRHDDFIKELKEYMIELLNDSQEFIDTTWITGFKYKLKKQLGAIPDSFLVDNFYYTPFSFSNSLGLDMNNYVLISSFTHHPFYEKFIIEIPDNWSWGSVYNIPLDELLNVAYNSLSTGYTFVWAADVSEEGFQFKDGIAEYITSEDENKNNYINQVNKQIQFDTHRTTDDHSMHVTGLAMNKEGEKYFYVKNSWGTNNKYNGYFFASEDYFIMKTIMILIHKDAIPNNIFEKLNLN